MNYEPYYADTDEKITKVVEALNRAANRGEVTGLDTEFYGVELRKFSTVGRSRLHLISTAVARFPKTIHPRGFSIADAAVLPRAAINHDGFRAWLEGPSKKAVHNLGVDAHTLRNEGVNLDGGINTLAIARWVWPGRARGPGFTLDSLAESFLGVGKTESYSELFREAITVERVAHRKVRVCQCGAIKPDRLHPRGNQHARSDLLQEDKSYKIIEREIPLETVVPGHPLWDRALRYSAQDAILALGIFEIAMYEMERRHVEIPWL